MWRKRMVRTNNRFLPVFSIRTACLYLIGGILCVEFWPILMPSWLLWPAVVLVLLSGFLIIRMDRDSARHYFASACIAVLVGILATHAEIYRQDHQMLSEPTKFSFEAVVESADWRGADERGERVRAVLTPINSPDELAPPTELENIGRVRLSMRVDEIPEAGSTIFVTAMLFPVSGPFLPGMADYGRAAYLRGIGASGFTYRVKQISPSSDDLTASHYVERLRSALNIYILARVDGPAGPVATSLYIGKRDNLPPDIYALFQKSGLAHLLAISGLHMALFCMSLYGLLRLLLLPAEARFRLSAHKVAAFLAIIAGFAYLLIAGMPTSAVRAWGMAVLILFAVIIDRRALTLRTLALIAILLLLWRPSFLFQTAFQLSFSATFAIIAAHAHVLRFIPRSGRFLGGFSFLVNLLISSLAAGIATMPFIAFYFAMFTPWSLLANLLAVPLMALLMPLGFIAFLVDGMGLSLGLIALYEAGITLLIAIAKLFSDLPASGIWIKPPALDSLVLWGLGICLLLAGGKYGFRAGIITLSLFGWLWVSAPIPDILQIPSNKARITILNSDEDLLSTAGLSDFWLSVIQKRVGPKPLRICKTASCPASLKGRPVQFIAHPEKKIAACKGSDRLFIAPTQPKYPCRGDSNLIVLPTIDSGSSLFFLEREEIRTESQPTINRAWRPKS